MKVTSVSQCYNCKLIVLRSTHETDLVKWPAMILLESLHVANSKYSLSNHCLMTLKFLLVEATILFENNFCVFVMFVCKRKL